MLYYFHNLINEMQFIGGSYMAKETQKEKIARLEKDICEYQKQNDILWDKINQFQENADNEFANSPYRKQLEEHIKQLEMTHKIESSLLENAKKREQTKDKKIESLQEQIQKLINENPTSKIKNVRGAGRKPKFNDKQIKEILELHQNDYTLSALSQKYHCSIGLIHKLINESSK